MKAPAKLALNLRVTGVRTDGFHLIDAEMVSLDLADDRLVVLVLLEDGRPARAFLIPTPAWRQPSPLLVDRDYEGLKSEPEWGIQLSGRSIPLLDEFDFAAQARSLP